MDAKFYLTALTSLLISFFQPNTASAQTPLPLVWDNIHIQKTNSGTTIVEWGILPEYNITEFLVQRSDNGRSFTMLKRMDATDALSYQVEDKSTGTTYYRVISVDAKGRASYSKIVSVIGAPATLSASYDGSSNVRIQKTDNRIQTVSLFDMSGRLLKSQTINNSISMVDVSSLPHGIYIIKFDQTQNAIKFFK